MKHVCFFAFFVVASACGLQREGLRMPDAPSEKQLFLSDTPIESVDVVGGEEDVYFRANKLGCQRVNVYVVCRAFDSRSNNPLRAAFITGSRDGRVVLELRAVEVLVEDVDGSPRLRPGNGGRRPVVRAWKPGQDRMTTRRMMRDLANPAEGEAAPPPAAPPALDLPSG